MAGEFPQAVLDELAGGIAPPPPPETSPEPARSAGESGPAGAVPAPVPSLRRSSYSQTRRCRCRAGRPGHHDRIPASPAGILLLLTARAAPSSSSLAYRPRRRSLLRLDCESSFPLRVAITNAFWPSRLRVTCSWTMSVEVPMVPMKPVSTRRVKRVLSR